MKITLIKVICVTINTGNFYLETLGIQRCQRNRNFFMFDIS